MTAPGRIPRTRRIALLVALACLLAPLTLAASGDPCCAGMVAPCHEDPSPCATLDVTPCCDVAPAAAQPTGERECAHSLQAAAARAVWTSCAPAPMNPAIAPAPVRSGSPPRLSVVLRN